MKDQTAIEEIKGKDLANFGARVDIRELAERIQMMMPGGASYTLPEALTLAQIAIAHNLDPFNGEVWLIKNEKTGKVLGALIGIKGHRKHAKVQSTYWGDFHRITDPTEYNAPERSIVFEYHIRDEMTMEAYTKRLEKLVAIDMKLDEAQKTVGKAPVTVGIGIWEPGEKTKMKPAQCAMFRAEKDALKRRFDVKFKIELDGGTIPLQTADFEDEPDADELEAEYSDMAEPRDTDEIIAELGYGPNGEEEEKDGSRPYAPTKVKDRIVTKASRSKNFDPTEKQQQLLRFALELCFPGDKEAADKRHTVLNYLIGDPSTKKVTGQYFKAIIEDWLNVSQDSGDEYQVDPIAAQEAQAIFTEALKIEGQQEMEL